MPHLAHNLPHTPFFFDPSSTARQKKKKKKRKSLTMVQVNIEWVLVNIVGNIGVALILIAYFSLTLQLISSHSIRHSLLNLCGALLIGVSLIFQFNLPSAVIEACWSVIATFGLVKALLRRYRNANRTTDNSQASSEKVVRAESFQRNNSAESSPHHHQPSNIIANPQIQVEPANLV